MYRQILIFTITILFFILGIGYLLIYILKRGVTRERERQDKVYGAAFYPIEYFVEQPGEENEYKQRLHWTKPVKRASTGTAKTFCKTIFRTSWAHRDSVAINTTAIVVLWALSA